MKISSKSILSPGRAGVRDPPNSLSTSLSRRLRNSGSIKGGASPAMFPTAAKKRGSFENPEPSSPKVTCIGQVRVKSKKKQAKKLRTLSRRHSTGEFSFRKIEHPLNEFPSKTCNHKESLNLGSKEAQDHYQDQNQECSPAQRSWVHFPVTICDALRAFGSEFSCLFPCRTERGKEEKTVAAEDGNRQGSCGTVFARWLVAVQNGDGGGERDIELVVGDEDEEEEEEESVVRKSRRHVFEDLEIINDRIEGHKDEARISICIPPKNALLLMRCRSDPMKIEALTNRSWEPTVTKTEEDEDEEFVDTVDQIDEDLNRPQENLEVEQQQVMILDQDQEDVQQDEAIQDQEYENVQQDEANDQEQENVQDEAIQDQGTDNVQQDELGQDQEHDSVHEYEVCQDQEHEQIEEEKEESLYLVSLFEEIVNQDYGIQEQDEIEIGADESTMVTKFAEIFETHEQEMVKVAEEDNSGHLERESEVKEERENEVKEERKSLKVLPECLLMMMYEPKLSMEVSKETWVCSSDFFKRHSNRRKPPPPPVKPDGGNESSISVTATVNDVKTVTDGVFPPVLLQPGRSSCSLPMAASMATVLEQKLANAVGYEPFVLTRCKSEPMKTAAAKLLPESCVLENRKSERSRVTFGVGAAGLGF